jgi:predicted house-cleaning NTP pyrophosphatase (Maf/HAM1 superfamily)
MYCGLKLVDCKQQCNKPYQKSYGAIAYSSKNKAWGTSNGWNSQGKAEQVALDNCSQRGPGCKRVVWFYNNCAAVAADGDIVTWGTDSSKPRAGEHALDQCKKSGGKKCELQTSTCSGT